MPLLKLCGLTHSTGLPQHPDAGTALQHRLLSGFVAGLSAMETGSGEQEQTTDPQQFCRAVANAQLSPMPTA